MEYRQHAPPLELATHLQCLWELSSEAGSQPELIVPDGCLELVLNFGAPFEQVERDFAREQPRVLFVGELRRPVITRPTGKVDLLGVRFRPGGAGPFLDAEMVEVVDGMHSDSALVPRLSANLSAVFASDPQDRVPRVLQALRGALSLRRREDALARRGVRELTKAHGQLEIATLSRALGVTPRHLERRFREHVGVSPKSLAQVLRFRRVLRVLEAAQPRWAELALELGYADQSHLIRDFKRFTGRPPGAYLQNSHPLTKLLDGASS